MDMTPRARQAIEEAEVIAGYNTYIKLIESLLGERKVIGTAMMQEIDRCKMAVSEAAQGHNTVVVSSGDAGVYGMAGLVLELVLQQPQESRPEFGGVIAGVGCRKGTPAALVMSALDAACRMIGRDRSFIDELASTIVKKHEPGIVYAGDSLVRPVKFYENDKMQQMIEHHQLHESDFVKKRIGIGNVCEAAAY